MLKVNIALHVDLKMSLAQQSLIWKLGFSKKVLTKMRLIRSLNTSNGFSYDETKKNYVKTTSFSKKKKMSEK